MSYCRITSAPSLADWPGDFCRCHFRNFHYQSILRTFQLGMADCIPSKRHWTSSSGRSATPTSTQARSLQQFSKRITVQHRNQRGSSTSLASSFGPHLHNPSSATHSRIDFAPERDTDINEREEDDSLNEVVMAIDLRDRGTVGCAYYVAREEKLYMMQDISSGGIETVELCKCSPICLDRR